MNHYEMFPSDVVDNLINLNSELAKETNENNPDREKIFKLRQRILMKGLEMSAGLGNPNYNLYRY
jgi:hypothetical protein